MAQELILVDEKNNVIGYGEKLKVHQEGRLHRAFSIFVLNDKDELLLQKRADKKYHSGGLWANTCCSHPLKGEDLEITIHQRLLHEMGFDCELKSLFNFIYKIDLDNNLTEHEYDYVFLGNYSGAPNPNPEEVSDWKWMGIQELNDDLQENPNGYVYWIKKAFPEFYKKYANRIL